MRKFSPKKYPPPPHTSREDSGRLKAKSLLCFGRSSVYKTMLRKGRWIETPGKGVRKFIIKGKVFEIPNVIKTWAPISVQEIDDTMDHILNERKKNQEELNGTKT